VTRRTRVRGFGKYLLTVSRSTGGLRPASDKLVELIVRCEEYGQQFQQRQTIMRQFEDNEFDQLFAVTQNAPL
jgi:hypothetical protein